MNVQLSRFDCGCGSGVVRRVVLMVGDDDGGWSMAAGGSRRVAAVVCACVLHISDGVFGGDGVIEQCRVSASYVGWASILMMMGAVSGSIPFRRGMCLLNR